MTYQKGQSMFEVLIALFIITLIIAGVVIMSTNSISNSIYSRNKTLAGRYSQEAIEWVRREKETDSSTFVVNTNTPRYCLDTLVWTNIGSCLASELITGTIFKREVSFAKSVVSTKNIIAVDVVTSWTDSKGYHEAKSITNFNDLRQK